MSSDNSGVSNPSTPVTDTSSVREGTISRHGGVMRYSFGMPGDTSGLVSPATKQSITAKVVGGVTSHVTKDGHTTTTTRTMSKVMPTELGAPEAGEAQFMSAAGRNLSQSEITLNSMVKVGGQQTTVAAALHCGLLRQNANGQYVSATGFPNPGSSAR